jgi:hypothetical protein
VRRRVPAGGGSETIRRELARRVLGGEMPDEAIRDILRELVAEAIEHYVPPARVTVLASADGGRVRMRSGAYASLGEEPRKRGLLVDLAVERRKRGMKGA